MRRRASVSAYPACPSCNSPDRVLPAAKPQTGYWCSVCNTRFQGEPMPEPKVVHEFTSRGAAGLQRAWWLVEQEVPHSPGRYALYCGSGGVEVIVDCPQQAARELARLASRLASVEAERDRLRKLIGSPRCGSGQCGACRWCKYDAETEEANGQNRPHRD